MVFRFYYIYYGTGKCISTVMHVLMWQCMYFYIKYLYVCVCACVRVYVTNGGLSSLVTDHRILLTLYLMNIDTKRMNCVW